MTAGWGLRAAQRSRSQRSCLRQAVAAGGRNQSSVKGGAASKQYSSLSREQLSKLSAWQSICACMRDPLC